METPTTTQRAAPRMGAVGRGRASVAALETLADIRAAGRTEATEDEKTILARWSGWGPLAPAFAPKDRTWTDLSDRIRAALDPVDVEHGMQATYNAFYTPRPVAEAMWRILTATGFPGGRVLDPGCGAGVFRATAPDLPGGLVMTGVDQDPTTAAICGLLHPDVNVVNRPFQSARLRGGYSAAIGNVPYGNVPVFDANAPAAVCGSLHNYFIWRTLDLLEPGGVAVLLTSRYTMDSASRVARAYMHALADLVWAFRLPNGALADGGTDVAADVLVLRRKSPVDIGREGYLGGFAWVNAVEHRLRGKDGDVKAAVNGFWVDQPDALLGEMRAGATQQHGLGLEVAARPGDPPPVELLRRGGDDVAEACTYRGLGWAGTPPDADAPADTEDLVTDEGWFEGSIQLIDDGVFRVEGGKTVPVTQPSKELRALLELRDLAVTLVNHEANHSIGELILAPLRRQLSDAYEAYRSRWGALNRSEPYRRRVKVQPDTDLAADVASGRVESDTDLDGAVVALVPTVKVPSMGGFRHDPDAALVFALEVYDDETGDAHPAPLLSARQNLPVTRPTYTDDPAEALAWSLNYEGRIDFDYIGLVLSIPLAARETRIPQLLGDAVFYDPEQSAWQPADEYLSGNVRAKLAVAERWAADEPDRYTRNVEALRKVLPKWLGPADITINLGSPWIDTRYVYDFIEHLLDTPAKVRRAPGTSAWEVDVDRYSRKTVKARNQWGTRDKDAFALIECALNNQSPVVRRKVYIMKDGEQKEVSRKDPDASLLAAEMMKKIEERFAEWLWEDPERTSRVVNQYNNEFNCLVAREFDGSHITIDGIAPWFVPYAHQLQFVARAVATRASLCGLPVGAGKTSVMAMVAMKLRQIGLVNKPMLVVPNHLKDQIEREIRQLFPAAKILAAASATVAANRRAFNARVATQPWDMIIVTHSAFDRMPVSPYTEERYVFDQVMELEEAIRGAAPDGKLEGRMVKGLAKRKTNLKADLQKLQWRKLGYDRGITFERMGVDFLIVDEAHYYKNLAVPVRCDGFTIAPSKRASHLDMILGWLADRSPNGRYATLLTGTPVSNTMLETYILLRYLMPTYLHEIGIGSADSWAQAFVQFAESVDVTIDGGGFRMVRRPRLFVNAPELRLLLSMVADIRTAEQIGLPRPGCVSETITVEPTAAQKAYSARLVQRVDDIRDRVVDEYEDNMLSVCSDGRRAATDMALVGIYDPEAGKLAKVAEKMLAMWRECPTELQIGFCDVGTPNPEKGAQTYGRLRDLLVAGGMPDHMVRFIHQAKSDADKARLFAECRAEGKVAVILGSTDKLGVGTNIQKRVIALHHIDAPWKPAEVEQREGRGVRPGNRNPVVHIFRYVVERTFDAYNWQLLTRKIGFIVQLLSGQLARTVEDIDSGLVDSYAAVKAAATGQPLLLEKARIDGEVRRLRSLQRGHQASVDQLRWEIGRMERENGQCAREAEAREAITANADGEADEAAVVDIAEAFASGKFRHWYGAPLRVAGLDITIGSYTSRYWNDKGKEVRETHPLIEISGGAGSIGVEMYAAMDAAQIAAAINRQIRDAERGARWRRETIATNDRQIAESTQLAARPFAEADKLTTALAQLDQIEAALRHAALQDEENEAIPEGAVVVERPDTQADSEADARADTAPPAPPVDAGVVIVNVSGDEPIGEQIRTQVSAAASGADDPLDAWLAAVEADAIEDSEADSEADMAFADLMAQFGV